MDKAPQKNINYEMHRGKNPTKFSIIECSRVDKLEEKKEMLWISFSVSDLENELRENSVDSFYSQTGTYIFILQTTTWAFERVINFILNWNIFISRLILISACYDRGINDGCFFAENTVKKAVNFTLKMN